MDNQEHVRFLQQKANEIHKLYLVPENKICFDTQMKRFEEMSAAWETALNQAEKDANADQRLRQEPKDENAEPPKEGYIWDHYNGLWRSEGPPDPMRWVWPLNIPKNEIEEVEAEENIGWDWFSELPSRNPTDSEKLMCDYFLLVVIHDGALDTVVDNRIYFDTTNKGPKKGGGCIYMWKDLNGSSIALIPPVALQLWKHLKICNSHKARTTINRVLMDVKADLTAKTPAEIEQNTKPVKEAGTKTNNKKELGPIPFDLGASDLAVITKKLVSDRRKSIIKTHLKPYWNEHVKGSVRGRCEFSGTIREYFWCSDFIPQILEDAICEILQQTAETCPKANLKWYVKEAGILLKSGLVNRVYDYMVRIDQGMRSKGGNLKSVKRVNVYDDKVPKMHKLVEQYVTAVSLKAVSPKETATAQTEQTSETSSKPEEFLSKIADEVDSMLCGKVDGKSVDSSLVKSCFKKQMMIFTEKHKTCREAENSNQQQACDDYKRIQSDPRYRDRGAGPPESGLIWDDDFMLPANCVSCEGDVEVEGWKRPQEKLPPDPTKWPEYRDAVFALFGNLLPCYYTTLAVIYNYKKRKPPINAQLTDDFHLLIIQRFRQCYGGYGESTIKEALRHVEKDLLEHAKPAEAGQKTAIGFMGFTDLAKHYGVDADALRKRLERRREKYPLDTDFYIESQDRGAGKSTYLYDAKMVAPIAEELKSKKTSNKRPSKKK